MPKPKSQTFMQGYDRLSTTFRHKGQRFLQSPYLNKVYYPLESKRTLIAVSHFSEILRRDESDINNEGNHFLRGILSVRELKRINCLRHPLRRREWLVARLLAKYMVLSGIAMPLLNIDSMIQWRPFVRFVNYGDLLAGNPSLFQKVELISIGRGEVPRLFWFEEDMSPFISCSVSHSGGWVVVAFSSGDCVIGADIEKVNNYSESFREAYFYDCEQAWIELTVSASGMSDAELYTLLWTFKESAFKAGGFGKEFLLRNNINVMTVLGKPLSLPGQAWDIAEMNCFEIEVFNKGWHSAQGASCFISPDYLLSVVTIKKGGESEYRKDLRKHSTTSICRNNPISYRDT